MTQCALTGVAANKMLHQPRVGNRGQLVREILLLLGTQKLQELQVFERKNCKS